MTVKLMRDVKVSAFKAHVLPRMTLPCTSGRDRTRRQTTTQEGTRASMWRRGGRQRELNTHTLRKRKPRGGRKTDEQAVRRLKKHPPTAAGWAPEVRLHGHLARVTPPTSCTSPSGGTRLREPLVAVARRHRSTADVPRKHHGRLNKLLFAQQRVRV